MRRPTILDFLFAVTGAVAVAAVLLFVQTMRFEQTESSLRSELKALKSDMMSLETAHIELRSSVAQIQGRIAKLEKNTYNPPSIILDPQNPLTQTVKKGVANIPLLMIRVTAGSQDFQITGMAFKSYGSPSSQDFANLKLFIGETQIGDVAFLDSRAKRVIFSDLIVLIPANVSTTMIVKANITETAVEGRVIQLGLDTQNSVESNLTAFGKFPIKGNSFTIVQ